MVGRKISHYMVEDRLGKGGMGEVFLARDLALGRAAAIKVLPASFEPELKRRLLREAEAARRLQHPGIATFFEAGEADGIAFIAMEYVRGETLRKRLRAGPLPAPAALGISGGLLEALGHAHSAGIVHRDIKPENVMLTGEHAAKLLDFGLARDIAVEAGDGDAATMRRTVLTEAGSLLGTIGYMAPEQLSGGAVGPRADLFAVGAVLYEMLSGRAAFDGSSDAARVAATLYRDPAPLTGVSSGIQGIVRRALARNPEERYGSTSEFLRDLRRLEEGLEVATYRDTLAILDFENRSADPSDAWIGSGIAESLATDLGRFSEIGIVPRARVLKAIAGEQACLEPSTTGHLLGCRWVLSGSYQKMGPALRIFMQVTHVPTERVTTSEKVDGLLEEIFAMQDRLGEKAAEALRLQALAPEAPAKAAPTVPAYERYARGRQHWLQMTKGGFDVAQEQFQQAIEQDPEYPGALAGLAAVHDMRFTFTTDRGELDRAVAHARRAIELEPRQPDAHVWLGYALWRQGRAEEALAVMKRAAGLDSSNMYPAYFSACILMSVGDVAGALPLYQRAVELGPAFGFAWVGLGNAHMELGNFAEATWTLDKGVQLEARAFHATAGADGYAGECLRRTGQLDLARGRCLTGLEAVERTDHMYRDTFRAICLCVLGRTALQQRDLETARAAYQQCELHLGGRPRTLGGGFLLCQALAGRAAVERDRALYEEARELLERRSKMDWSWFWLCEKGVVMSDLASASEALGHSLGRRERP